MCPNLLCEFTAAGTQLQRKSGDPEGLTESAAQDSLTRPAYGVGEMVQPEEFVDASSAFDAYGRGAAVAHFIALEYGSPRSAGGIGSGDVHCRPRRRAFAAAFQAGQPRACPHRQ